MIEKIIKKEVEKIIMKKYNVFDLYVVEVQKDFQSYFFLCKYNKGKELI